MDLPVHKKTLEDLRGCLEDKEDNKRDDPQREDEDDYNLITNVKIHFVIKSFYLWKDKPRHIYIL